MTTPHDTRPHDTLKQHPIGLRTADPRIHAPRHDLVRAGEPVARVLIGGHPAVRSGGGIR